MEKTYTRGALARAAEVNPETLRYYERRGLLPPPPRTRSGYRRYDEDALRRLRFIARARDLGFSLEEIKELLSLRVAPGKRCGDVRERAKAKVEEVAEKIRDLERMKRTLERLVAACGNPRAKAADCPILEALDAPKARAVRRARTAARRRPSAAGKKNIAGTP